MKTKSIIYQGFAPKWTTIQKQPEVNIPSFGYYRPVYNWDDSTEQEATNNSETKPTTETKSNQESIQTPQSETKTESYTQSSKPRGSHVFKTEDINVGNMQELLDKFADAGISLRVTSGLRPGAVTSNGSQSWHSKGYALDITPVEGQTYEDLKRQIRQSPDLIKYMRDNGFGIYDETSTDVLNRTNGTGFHWHIGKDRIAVQGLEQLLA